MRRSEQYRNITGQLFEHEGAGQRATNATKRGCGVPQNKRVFAKGMHFDVHSLHRGMGLVPESSPIQNYT